MDTCKLLLIDLFTTIPHLELMTSNCVCSLNTNVGLIWFDN